MSLSTRIHLWLSFFFAFVSFVTFCKDFFFGSLSIRVHLCPSVVVFLLEIKPGGRSPPGLRLLSSPLASGPLGLC